ncbi:MAG TPA: TonB family protein [Verrucomicrobiae bacterium]|nr:TonB family protein [Verrucomicrobiae bacterium]
MNRLQKKCIVATVGIHLLLLMILIVGSAFFNSEPKPDNTRLLDMIPANVLENALNSGVSHAAPPPPPPAPLPPPPPQPVISVPAPHEVTPTPVPRVEPQPKPDVTPAPARAEIKPHVIQPNLTPTTRSTPTTSAPRDNNSQNNSRAINNLVRSLKNELSPATEISLPGDSTAAQANYASVVKSVYEQAWIPPDNVENDDANTKVSVTIASDGTVINAHIITPSGDAGVDASVQRTLDQVTFVQTFPAGSTDKQRTYVINFNLKAKQMLE